MEFWPENQGQSPLYAKFGTVPGRSFAQNYHDRHQATHYPLYYTGHQAQGRESYYWTAPVSRPGESLHECTNWTDQDLISSTSSQFPFILDHHPQQHQDLGEYQLHDARDRDWTTTQRAAREYERVCRREGWQRRMEPCSPVRYNREISAKRNDNSYRELEAWAARYSHSLPRRKRIEAELRGASQGLLESRALERDSSRSGTDPRVAALQQVIQSANIRESGLWDRGGRQQGLTHYPSQTPGRDTSHLLDMKEKASYQRRMFSQPPGYIAPPPYNSPHKSSPGLHQCDTGLEKESKKLSSWSQPTLQNQDVSVDPPCQGKVEKEDFTQDGNQKTFQELRGLKHRLQETDLLQASSPDCIETTNIPQEDMVCLQRPQVLQAVQNKWINEDSSSKVIEGRKFRLNRKTGGMTIFCLVSRIASTSETQSLPLCTPKVNIQDTESKGISKDVQDNDKLADEVDFRALALIEQSDTSDLSLQDKKKETPTAVESVMLEDQSKTSPTSVGDKSNAESSIGKQVPQLVPHVSAKYPLWREPSLTSKEGSFTCSKVIGKEDESFALQNQEASVKLHPIDIEVRRLDITKAAESDESNSLLVIDTTCVCVKMELIPSPKKEHVHYLHSSPNTEDSPPGILSTISTEVVQSSSQLNQDVTDDQEAQTNPLQLSEGLKAQQDKDLSDEPKLKEESEPSSPCMLLSSVSNRETLAERAERILGISLQDCITDQQPEDPSSIRDSILESQDAKTSPVEHNSCEAIKQLKVDTQAREESQNWEEVSQTKDQKDPEDRSQEVTCVSEENDDGSQIQAKIKCSLEIETLVEPLLGSTNGKDTIKQNLGENQPVENNTILQPPQLIALNFEKKQTPLPLSTYCQSSASSTEQSSIPQPIHTDQSLSPSPLDVTDQTAEVLSSSAEDQDEWRATSHLILNTEISHTLTEEEEERVSKVDFKSGPPDVSSCLMKSNITDDELTKQSNKHPTGHIEEDAKEINIFQQQGEDVVFVKDRYMTEEQLLNEVIEDLTDHIKEETLKMPEEYAIQVNFSELQTECIQSDVACAKDFCTTEEQQPQEVSENLKIDFQKTVSLQPQAPGSSPPSPNNDLTPLHFDVLSLSELSSPPDPSLEIGLEFPSALNPVVDVVPAVDAPATFPPPLHLESCEEYLQLPSSSDSPTVLLLSSLPPLSQEECEDGSHNLALKEQPQCPQSLWDAVNRIRKHTAPDSENEEEEMSELWDPESIVEDLGCPEAAENMTGKRRLNILKEGSVDVGEEGKIKLCGHDEDTLSCSSTSSQGSRDTMILADEDEFGESQPEINKMNNEEFERADVEQCCSCEDKAKSADEKLKNNVGDEGQSEDSQMEEANISTKEAGNTETEQQETEVFLCPSEVPLFEEGMTESESKDNTPTLNQFV